MKTMIKKEVIVPADDLVCLGKDKLQELIRCKDCKWYSEEDCLRENVVETGVFYQSIIEYPLPNDFCSRAKRKEE